MRSPRPIFILAVIILCLNAACKKESLLTTGGELRFSTDTLTFDTVFTSMGSFTNEVKLFNPQGQKVVVSSVRLEGGDNSYFHLNVNGVQGNSVQNVEIASNDSIYIFATVNIDPDDRNTPFVVEDRIIATLNGKDYSIPIMAYGQNAYYIVGEELQTQEWGTDKPYVILHSAQVDTNATLTIKPGCRVYMHADSRLYVSGTLLAEGTKQDTIVFQGDRLDRKYFGNEGYPGEWGGIVFMSTGHDSKLDYVTLKNCGGSLPAAIYMEPAKTPGTGPQLTIKHSVIENSLGYGIVSFQGNIHAENCLVNTCGAQALAIFQGGVYDFYNCDFVIYGTNKVSHVKEPAVAILNYLSLGNNTYTAGELKAILRNCVIWGSLEDELFIDKVDDVGFNLTLDHCLVRTKEIPSYVSTAGLLLNQDPMFRDYKNWDYRPQEGSPLINAGVPAVTDDLDGKPRTQPIDIGCYEGS